MKIENTGLEGVEIEFQAIEDIMEGAGFHYVYDYERVTFDYKIVIQGDIYYLRVQAHAVEGEVPSPHGIVKITNVLLGKHYYPHGVEYDEEFSKQITDKCNKKLESVKDSILSEAK
ncbi:YugN family protein [Evansella cellulosilytica]|uniref:YugN-like family protein n=1 Tax=Evansella cellulosilytica (strain ATCC 21833 / DSM 2522 / FERM P-1141 / JCM 9156 / N-4) TaxID=649639 RepID=E6TUJ2_EVAC2|nr:YugN family protein [Evansella cellulosilytica]ADU30882.1 protein of unknown function YugN-like protein [Evansella cellulosilytica DSM 2522]